jgi:hypothetical protein
VPARVDHPAGRSARGQHIPIGNPPRITIEQTPFNDLYLILDMLFPSAQTVRILRDPAGFARSQEETLRAAWQMIQHSVEVGASRHTVAAAAGKPPNNAREPGDGPDQSTSPAPHRRQMRHNRTSSRTLLR